MSEAAVDAVDAMGGVRRQRPDMLNVVLYALITAVPVYVALTGDSFVLTLGTRVLAFAIAALSLDFILGYGGLVSFGHAAFIGVGAYAVGILASYGLSNILVQGAAVAVATGLAALVIGGISLRTSGVSFIMITLAFSQLFFFGATSLSRFGGDDGFGLARRSTFGSLTLADPTTLYITTGVMLLLVHLGFAYLIGTPFGRTLEGSRQSEVRLRAIGLSPYRTRLVAFVLSAVTTGFAGALLTNTSGYISPESMSWQSSGDLILMIVVGGVMSLTGPIVGAAIYILAQSLLAQWTAHWALLIGFVLILIVRFGRRGIVGMLRRP